MPLVKDPNNIRLAMFGMVDGNGHPFSWSAIINGGYDKAKMADCGYPGIGVYLNAEPAENLGIPGVQVTHVWCNDPRDSIRVSEASYVPHVVKRPEDVIGQVDAVIIATDIGHEHVDRARPFIEAGLPVFVDKPMTDNEEHLRQFVAWHGAGKPLLSSSCMRYGKEYGQLRQDLAGLGDLRLLTMSMCKSWERYGIHALEGVYPLLAPGQWKSVTNSGDIKHNIVHARHGSGVEVILADIADMYGAFGVLTAYGTKGWKAVPFVDTFHAFKAQLVAFVDYLRTGRPPIDFQETVELMKIVIAGIRSRDENGRRVSLDEIRV